MIAATPLVLCEPTIARFGSNLALCALFDKAYPLNTSLIVGEASSDVINEAAVDFVNDLQMTGGSI